MGSPVSSQKPYSPDSMRAKDCEIFFRSFRSRSRVRNSSACSSSIVARSAGSGTIEVSSRRCSVVSPALLSRSSFNVCSFLPKNSSCFSFMYSDSGIASNSGSVSSRPLFDFQALASLGSDFWACRGMSSSMLFICRVGGRGGAKRSANRDVGGGRGVGICATKYLEAPRPALRGFGASTTTAGVGFTTTAAGPLARCSATAAFGLAGADTALGANTAAGLARPAGAFAATGATERLGCAGATTALAPAADFLLAAGVLVIAF